MTQISASVKAYEKELVALHTQMARKSPSQLLDELRDQLVDLGTGLTSEQAEFFHGLSADLYMLQSREIRLPHLFPMSSPEVIDALRASIAAGHWFVALELMRRNTFMMQPEHTAYFRGRCYWQLGYFEAASAFVDFAAARMSSSQSLLAFQLELHFDAQHLDRLLQAIQDTMPETSLRDKWRVEMTLASVYWRLLSEERILKDDSIVARFLRTLPLSIQNESEAKSSLRDVLASAHCTLGGLYYFIGDREAARVEFEKSLSIRLTEKGQDEVTERLREMLDRWRRNEAPTARDVAGLGAVFRLEAAQQVTNRQDFEYAKTA
jgi:tetratricopeptide (TPR) repeat protein